VVQNEDNRVDVAGLLFSFEGRIGRRAFVALWLAAVVIQLTLPFLLPGQIDDEPDPAMVAAHFNKLWAPLVIALLCAWISLAGVTRRRHDLGRSGWPLLFDVLALVVAIPASMYCASASLAAGVVASATVIALATLYAAWLHIQCLLYRGDAVPNAYGPPPGERVTSPGNLEMRLNRKVRLPDDTLAIRPGSRSFGRR
jgi:uncharacterized membrane protein YhaH (DUF805 family)